MRVSAAPRKEGVRLVDRADPGVGIRVVRPGGIGEAIGLLPGDVIATINGRPVRDPIDYRFHMADETVTVLVSRDGAATAFEIEKDPDEDLEVDLEEMPILKCDNKCVFCFLHQMPKRMRKTLYYQDDDYRLSFLHGAYVTLTNIAPEEFDRIVEQRLSPMYVSVHATDPVLRGALLGRSGPDDVLERMDRLAAAGIHMHSQVVLCPGINDGPHLERTVDELAARHPAVESVGVVPLGLTQFRKNLPVLEPVTPEGARKVVDHVHALQARLRKRLGTRFVYLGDEFYIQAGLTVPKKGAYDGFPLVENGIGMVRRFLDDFDAGWEDVAAAVAKAGKSLVTLVTSVLGGSFMQGLVDRLNALGGPRFRLVVVVNRFLGEGITVSGLLTFRDIRDALQEAGVSEGIVVLPPNCLNHDSLFLDDATVEDLAESLGVRVESGTYSLPETIVQTLGPTSRPPTGPRPRGVEEDGAHHPYIDSHQVL